MYEDNNRLIIKCVFFFVYFESFDNIHVKKPTDHQHTNYIRLKGNRSWKKKSLAYCNIYKCFVTGGTCINI